MASIKTNIVARKKRRIQPKEGDVFRLEMVGSRMLFGRVVRRFRRRMIGDAVILYFFQPGATELTTSNLLLPPQLAVPAILIAAIST